MEPRDVKRRNRTAGRCRSKNERFTKRRRPQLPAVETYTENWDKFWRSVGLSLLATVRSITVGFTYLYRRDAGDRLAKAYGRHLIVSPPVLIVISALVVRLCVAGRDTAGRLMMSLPAVVGMADLPKTFIDTSDATSGTIIALSVLLSGLVSVSLSFLLSRRDLPTAFHTGYLYTYLVVGLAIDEFIRNRWFPLFESGPRAIIYFAIKWVLLGIPLFALTNTYVRLIRTLQTSNSLLIRPEAYVLMLSWFAITFTLVALTEGGLTAAWSGETRFTPEGISCEGSLSEKNITCRLMIISLSRDTLVIDGNFNVAAVVSDQNTEISLAKTKANSGSGEQSPPLLLESGKSSVFSATFLFNDAACNILAQSSGFADITLGAMVHVHPLKAQYQYSSFQIDRFNLPASLGQWKIKSWDVHWADRDCHP